MCLPPGLCGAKSQAHTLDRRELGLEFKGSVQPVLADAGIRVGVVEW